MTCKARESVAVVAAAPKSVSDRHQTSVEIIDGEIVVKAVVEEERGVEETAEKETMSMTTSRSFTNRSSTERWGLEETRRFYLGLQQFGTDFSLMQSLFPGRTQRELKNKYRREERHHGHLVALALDAPRQATDFVAVPLLLRDGGGFDARHRRRSPEEEKADEVSPPPPPASGVVVVGPPSVFDASADDEADLVSL
ncbi:hypothetical protein CTAYLR_007250 [Chrysophaeum taylorii]|uniref:Myb-like domain-containing protein n=1 Tax=Chrysophaeum taylorii TaxID=2483200 RepID=A0AAD7UBZ7_9STRA|nr:hypothetical protein CTAYLR_007250 [Chrysophaeum taylorii]